MEKLNNIENTTSLDAKIQQIIIKMDLKRGHKQSLDSGDIRNKIFSTDPNKPGEYFEFMEEYKASGRSLSSHLALEMADIIYYTSQKNCPYDLKSLATDLEIKIGISHEMAQRFCIIKYECRLQQPIESSDYKEIENIKMTEFLNNKKLIFLPR